jgi:hypothetical protein
MVSVDENYKLLYESMNKERCILQQLNSLPEQPGNAIEKYNVL